MLSPQQIRAIKQAPKGKLPRFMEMGDFGAGYKGGIAPRTEQTNTYGRAPVSKIGLESRLKKLPRR